MSVALNVEDFPEEVSLRQLVRERLEVSDEPDPHRVINGMVHELPHDTLIQAAQFGLIEIAKHLVRVERQRESSSGATSSGKWDSVREAARQHRDIFAQRIWTGEVWKFMADCTKQDLVGAAEVKREQAGGLLADVTRLEKLSRALKRDQTVSDLDRSKVEGIFNA